jgi:4-diphosphocytidyl-2-C-methyl-D-erythritol kinase
MIDFPNAKINIGLKILRKRNDGFHDIQSILYPVGLCDVLEIQETPDGKSIFECTGTAIHEASSGSPTPTNLVMKAFDLISKDFGIPPLNIHLHKNIPAGAGLGGGSSDAAFMLKMLNSKFRLNLSDDELAVYASQLGSDCTFFLKNTPALANGKGEILRPIRLDLTEYYLLIVKPDIHINTAWAYSLVKPDADVKPLDELVKRPVEEWNKLVVNDFEKFVFEKFPDIQKIKMKMYESGAVYASMSGSGSAVFGMFIKQTENLQWPENYFSNWL